MKRRIVQPHKVATCTCAFVLALACRSFNLKASNGQHVYQSHNNKDSAVVSEWSFPRFGNNMYAYIATTVRAFRFELRSGRASRALQDLSGGCTGGLRGHRSALVRRRNRTQDVVLCSRHSRSI